MYDVEKVAARIMGGLERRRTTVYAPACFGWSSRCVPYCRRW
ncbi:hypothetical protein ABZ923_11960 [Streptomyces sp. NPDC046881]